MESFLEWFAQPGASDFAQWTISLLALILSGVGIFMGVLNNRRERSIQGRLLAIEEERREHQRTEAKRARLRSYMQKSTQPGTYHIVIRNEGEAVARNLQVILDDKPILEHPAIPHGVAEPRRIGPKSEIKYLAAIDGDCSPPFDLLVRWKDESGEDGEYETTLT